MIDERSESWKLSAACVGEDPTLWFPVDNTKTSRENTAVALSICAGCEVKTECLEFGWRELFGTWGGMTQRDRLLSRREEFRRDRAWQVALALVSVDVEIDDEPLVERKDLG